MSALPVGPHNQSRGLKGVEADILETIPEMSISAEPDLDVDEDLMQQLIKEFGLDVSQEHALHAELLDVLNKHDGKDPSSHIWNPEPENPESGV